MAVKLSTANRGHGSCITQREPVNLYLLANHIKPVLSQNAQHRQRMIMAIESGELLKEAMRLFKECDRDRNGKLTWNQGEIRSFISQVLQHYNLIVPSEEQLYLIYRHFDKDTSYSLDVRESLCLADAVVRSMFLDVSPAHSAVSRSSVRSLRFSEMGSPPLRRPAMNHDEELARRVANQESAMEKKLERLIRACNDAVSLRLMVSLMHVTFSAWRQCATKNLFAKEKEAAGVP
ncbi:Sulfatase-modifying factor 2 [Durusdinium trenchii]|uniref:Sulfatase-modifying factor 2 n=1 Tax=Durusdinium trenchii TaxID=1381693 RepID=A0ABP0S0B6_9DINO